MVVHDNMFRSQNRLLAMPMDGLDGPFHSFTGAHIIVVSDGFVPAMTKYDDV